jgi:hypothetical protein
VFVQKFVDGIIGPGGPWYAGECLKWACRAGLDVSVIRGLAEEVDPHSEWEGYIDEATRWAVDTRAWAGSKPTTNFIEINQSVPWL